MIPHPIVHALADALRYAEMYGADDNFMSASKEALAAYDTAVKEPVRVRLPAGITNDTVGRYLNANESGRNAMLDEVIAALKAQGIEVDHG